MKKEQLEGIYKSFGESDNGKIIIKDLQDFTFRRPTFFAEDIPTDALLREGARQLLTYLIINCNNKSI